MADGNGVSIIGNLLPQLGAALHDVSACVVKDKAQEIAQYASDNHPYQDQTGQAASAFYVVTADSSTYGAGFIGGSGKDGEEILPQVEAPGSDQEAIVANASGHFLYLELGTSRMPAFPSLIPAFEAVAQTMADAGWEEKISVALGGGL